MIIGHRSLKLVFTGGHHNSALELARYLKEHHNAEILWLGHKFTGLSNTNISAEYKEVTDSGIPFYELKAGKLYKTFHPTNLLRIPFGFIQALLYLIRHKPNLVVSFGGYLAVPVVFAGFLLRIPSVTHEQTTVVGLANKFIAFFAKKVFITWPSSKDYFPAEKVVIVGLPIRKALFEYNTETFVFPNNLPVVYITAGKQGSHTINLAVSSVLDRLLNAYNVIHQCGESSEYKDNEVLTKQKNKLPQELQERYIVKGYIFQDEIGSAFHQAHIVVSRAGAHTIYELAALAKPSLLIPIPWASRNEQLQNAQLLQDLGAAVIIEQKDLSGEKLLISLEKLQADYQSYQAGAHKVQQLVRLDAVEKMAQEIMSFFT